MKFDTIVPNTDIDVHPEPPGLWQHVAVVCRWKDARAQRHQWPHAAVIGPLRSVRGLDDLARNLLHNPQIRVVLVVGHDQSDAQEVTRLLIALWRGDASAEQYIGEEVRGPFVEVRAKVQLVCPDPEPEDRSDPAYIPTGMQVAGELLTQWKAVAKFPSGPPPWTHATKPPGYEPPCGHFHGRYGCTNDWCGYGEGGTLVTELRVGGSPNLLAYQSLLAALIPGNYTSERPKVTLPPPPPKSTASGPPGDPGERVVGETLAELWPQVLHRALRFGAIRPTQYGDTRELLCLVGVVRDVGKSIGDLGGYGLMEAALNKSLRDGNLTGGLTPADAGIDVPVIDWRTVKHPILGISYNAVEAYRDRVSTSVLPEGVPYSYGSRMRGKDLPHKPYRVASGLRPSDADYKVLYDEDCCARTSSCIRSRDHEGHCDREEWWENEKNLKRLNDENDQITSVEKLLAEKSDTRAAYVTPWRAAEDAGKESGRPCMVGAWWRVEPSPGKREATGDDKGVEAPAEGRSGAKVDPRNVLHLVVAFRSHDLFAAYPTNLAGILLWQLETAGKLGMRAGSLTVTSYSAHIYARDWNAAEAVVQEHYEKARYQPRWDQRSSWYVELVPPVVAEKPVEVGETLQIRRHSEVVDTWEVQAEPVTDADDHVWVRNQSNGQRKKIPCERWRYERGDFRGPQPKPTLRATGLSPDGRERLVVLTAETPEALCHACERSGLVTSIGAAMWLGDEIRRVYAGGGHRE